ncbi:MAG: TlyA family RNA methyltransferase [Acholeplasmatales bacterium]|nr:TlyA family RNA methyltransferase [Acholeplasmatales bacterium]
MRLDSYLQEKGYVESRNKAKTEIENGNVYINDKQILKSSFEVNDNDKVELKDKCPYVSRGGYKLMHAIKTFNLDFKNKGVLDIGASTGGFTDCSLQNGASYVISVDVGTNQLHESLKADKRVISLENTNIKDLNELPKKIDIIVMDVSFVSIEFLIEDINKFIDDDTIFVCLIKPQFEVGKIHLKNGIVKDKSMYVKILENIDKELSKYNLGIKNIALSPILGGSGNKEFISLIKRNYKTNINFKEFVRCI